MFEDAPSDIMQKAREGRGLSLRALADETGISVQEIQNMEEGRIRPTDALLNALRLSQIKFHSLRETVMAETPSATIGGGLLLKTFPVEIGGITANAYLLIRGHYALLVDSIGTSEDAMNVLKNEGFEPQFLLITHGHFDHIGGIERVKRAYPTIRVIHGRKDVPHDTRHEIDGFTIDVITTPGHTEDAVSYLANDTIAFVGDTIFARSVGRPNYSLESLLKNIREKIFVWSDSVILAPGHGPLTTIGEEKKYNPFF